MRSRAQARVGGVARSLGLGRCARPWVPWYWSPGGPGAVGNDSKVTVPLDSRLPRPMTAWKRLVPVMMCASSSKNSERGCIMGRDRIIMGLGREAPAVPCPVSRVCLFFPGEKHVSPRFLCFVGRMHPGSPPPFPPPPLLRLPRDPSDSIASSRVTSPLPLVGSLAVLLVGHHFLGCPSFAR